MIFLGTGVLLIEQNTRQVFELNLNQLSEEQKSLTEGLNWYIYTSSVRDSRRGIGKTNEYIREYMENRPGIRGMYYLITEAGENAQEVYSNLDLELPVMPPQEVTYTPQYKIPVSYTHLDVYKRQPLWTADINKLDQFSVSFFW